MVHCKTRCTSVNWSSDILFSYSNSSIEDFWEWTENVFADAVHLQDSQTDEEHGYLLGVARMRLIRSKTSMYIVVNMIYSQNLQVVVVVFPFS